MASLYFERKEFLRGTMIIEDREPDENGDLKIVKKEIPVSANRQRLQISDIEYVLSKYPKWFHRRKPMK